MSRSGYHDDCDDDLALGRYRGVVASATRGKRGQEFFKALVDALDAMPEKRLIADELEAPDGAVCAIGALGKARGLDMTGLDPDDPQRVGKVFNIAEALAREVVFENDEASGWKDSPESRWCRMRAWARQQIKLQPPATL